MKKFLLFSVVFIFGLLPDLCLAGCGDNKVELRWPQTLEDNEFLYENMTVYEEAVKKKSTYADKIDNLSGLVWECDNSYCGSLTYIAPESDHVWQKKNYAPTYVYECKRDVEDRWEQHYLEKCDKNSIKDYKKVKLSNESSRQIYSYAYGTIFCYLDDGEQFTTDLEKICKSDPYGIWNGQECQCGNQDGIIRHWDSKQEKCVETGERGGKESVSCTQRYGCYKLPADKQKACVACCSVSASVANWNQNTQICECVNKSQTFNPDTKVCSGGDTVSAPVVIAPTPTEPEKYDCDIDKLLELRAKHSKNSEIVSLIDELIEKCEEGITETEYNSLYINITVVITNIQDAGLASSRTNILNAISKLDNLSSGFKESVWKNEEGEFNTSRLISDSVAGVVLGTAGGLITSSVVKKNQVENGFEDIQCTVGGQVVAGWGDQFQVGIQ